MLRNEDIGVRRFSVWREDFGCVEIVDICFLSLGGHGVLLGSLVCQGDIVPLGFKGLVGFCSWEVERC